MSCLRTVALRPPCGRTGSVAHLIIGCVAFSAPTCKLIAARRSSQEGLSIAASKFACRFSPLPCRAYQSYRRRSQVLIDDSCLLCRLSRHSVELTTAIHARCLGAPSDCVAR